MPAVNPYFNPPPDVRVIGWLDRDEAERVDPREGDAYVFLYDVSTRAGHVHPKGSTLCVLDRTTKTPHMEIGPRGVNWVCETQFGVSIWATLEHCIERGLLARQESERAALLRAALRCLRLAATAKS